jgi:hypothetical protein
VKKMIRTMSFSKKYKQLGDVLAETGIQHIKGVSFILNEKIQASDYFKQDIKLTLEEVPYNISEYAICETLVYPTLREVWKNYYRQSFSIWSRALVKLNLKIKGYPDYLIAKRLKQSPIIFGHPFMAVVEAKLDDFEGAWGQCLYEMWAIQQLNTDINMPVYGITSSGLIWQFGKLENGQFTQYETLFTIKNIDELFSALKTFFEQCKITMQTYDN